MRRKIWLPSLQFLMVVLILLYLPSKGLAKSTSEYETPLVFAASKILPPDLLTGEDYQILPAVYNDGVYNRYELSTTFGPLTVEGQNLLMIRLQEIKAIRALEELKRTEVYGEALKNAAISPLKFAKSMVLQPIDTLSNAATGVGKWFGSIGHSIWGGGSEHEEGTLKTILGFDTVKRRYAHQFGVDPYSSYPALQERLNEVSWTAFAGSLTVKVAFSVLVPGVGGTVIRATSFTNGMKKLIADVPPAGLKELNEEKLTTMGVHESLTEVFLEHPQFSPTQKTYLVGALEQMTGVALRERFIQAAVLVQEEGFAYFRRRQAEMMAAYHKKVQPVEKFLLFGGAPVLLTKNGRIVMPVPIDHVVWTSRLAGFSENILDLSKNNVGVTTEKEIWLAGTASELTKKNFEERGWIIKENIGTQLTLD